MSLDEKLREILEDSLEWAHDGVYTDPNVERDTIAQIRQCFLEQGWKEPDVQAV